MALVPIRNINDTYINENRPDSNYGTVGKLHILGGTSPKNKVAYMFWPLSIRRMKVFTGMLNLYQGPAITGSVTVSVRALNQQFSVNTVDWSHKKTLIGPTVSVTKSSPVAGTLWQFDIKAILQSVADGTRPWYGVEVSIDVNTAGIWFHSSQSLTSDLRPFVQLDASTGPAQPDQLSPGGNRVVSLAKPILRSRFRDINGESDLAFGQWQIAPTVGELGSATDWDTGLIPITEPELDLSTSSYPGIPLNGEMVWRVQYRDAGGADSGWSEPQTVRRIAKPAPTWTFPSTVNDYVEETTPTVIWSAGGTQLR
jgi:hypothetical protein